MDDFWATMEEKWPSHLPPFNKTALEIVGTSPAEVRHSGAGLKAPFHRGICLYTSFADLGAAEGDMVSTALAGLVGNHVEAVEMLREVMDKVDQIISGSGATAVCKKPTRYFINTYGNPVLDAEFEIEKIDNGLQRTTETYELGTSGLTTYNWGRLKREIKAQPKREERSGRGLVVDSVLGWHLASMPSRHLQALADLLAKHPVPTGEDAGLAYKPEWNAKRLLRYGIHLPKEIDSILSIEGRIWGRVRLGDKLTWNNGRLSTFFKFPETTLVALVGRKISALATHPSLPTDLIIKKAARHVGGATVVNVDATGLLVRFPHELPARKQI